MTRYVGSTVETLLRRVREQGGLATDLDFATQVISICQRVINISLQRVIEEATLNTKAEKLLYWIREELPNCLDVLYVREGNRKLFRCKTLVDLSAYDVDWFRKIDGTQFDAWFQFARDVLVIYPAKATTSSVMVAYVKSLTEHTSFSDSYNTAMDLPDEDVDLVLLLAETILLARSRKFETLESKLKRLEGFLNEQS